MTGVERLGAYDLIRALDAAGPADPRPGQFYMLAAADGWGGGADERPYLPRAFSYARAREATACARASCSRRSARAPRGWPSCAPGRGPGPGGPARHRLPPAGATARGRCSWAAASAPRRCSAWQEELGAGRRGAARASAPPRTPRRPRCSPATPALATDDGSAGRQALVTDLLREELDADPGATVYACGPPPMLEAVRALCAERGVPAQLALESGMACGFGACFGCVVPTRDGYVRLCVDGPVLDAAELETALVAGAGH